MRMVRRDFVLEAKYEIDAVIEYRVCGLYMVGFNSIRREMSLVKKADRDTSF